LGKVAQRQVFNPWHERQLLLFETKHDPHVPYECTKLFAVTTGARLKSLRRGGQVSTEFVVRRYWPEIKRFFASALR
jgi:hypothetical protein